MDLRWNTVEQYLSEEKFTSLTEILASSALKTTCRKEKKRKKNSLAGILRKGKVDDFTWLRSTG